MTARSRRRYVTAAIVVVVIAGTLLVLSFIGGSTPRVDERAWMGLTRQQIKESGVPRLSLTDDPERTNIAWAHVRGAAGLGRRSDVVVEVTFDEKGRAAAVRREDQVTAW